MLDGTKSWCDCGFPCICLSQKDQCAHKDKVGKDVWLVDGDFPTLEPAAYGRKIEWA